MAIAQVLSALLDYLNASPAGEQGCVKGKRVNTSYREAKVSHGFYSTGLGRGCGIPPTSVPSLLKRKLVLLFPLPLFNQAAPSPSPASSQATDTMPD